MRGDPFTVDVPEPLPVVREKGAWWTVMDDRRLRLSNLDKVFWPDEGYTKGDLLAYYHNVAPMMLPHLAGRPLTMKRMPDGITGPHFYEKNAPKHTPDWMPRCTVHSSDAEGGRNDFLMAGDRASVLFVANLGCIEFHPLHGRCGTIDLPDYLFFDLDPFEPATFDDVLAVALHVRAALGALGLPSYPKTSGATGMQIYVPLLHGPTYEVARGFVETVGRLIVRADPQRATMEWQIPKRAGKVFIDHNMNRRGANIAGVYSVRPEPRATVSAPLRWDEVEAGCHPSDFRLDNAHTRFRTVADPFAGMLSEPVDLRPALEGLGLATDFGVAEPASSLADYERKRRFEETPEPGPVVASSPGGNSFVIQKHDATRLHYDLRLERDGAMPSWALPKGLPMRKGVRHLAVRTEDHPLEYASFSGEIPAGNYGAGDVRIYDRGTYDPIEWDDARKVTFRLHGERHHGEWHLIKTDRDWLVLLASASEPQFDEPPSYTPMLAELWKEPFDDPDWRFESKLDGVRTLAYVTTDSTRLVSRTGKDQTGQYPELGSLARFVNAAQAVIDGEIVASDEEGRPSFQRLQQRMNLASASEIERIRQKVPVTMFAFDLLWLDGSELVREPLEERRRLLEEIVSQRGPLRLTVTVDGDGKRFHEAARGLGLEGIVAKRHGSAYVPGKRSRDWRKIKLLRSQSCVILGWTQGGGGRASTFGALLVGAHRDGELVWIGHVGTGFDGAMLADMMERLRAIETSEPPVRIPKGEARGARWVRPELVCEVEYLEITKGSKLRAPSFKGLRTDKRPEDCVLP